MSSRPPIIPVKHALEIHLPKEVESLYELAHNLWWTWSPEAQQLFSAVHSWAWSHYQNPVEVLHAMDEERWQTLIGDDTFMSRFATVVRDFESYMAGADEGGFARRVATYDRGPIAYFSMEYGLHQSLALYSGGLGVLSGDHCKSASDLGLPLVGLGLLYRSGYFRQTIDAEGFQQHSYPDCDYLRLGARPVANRTGGDLSIEIPFPGRRVVAKVWTLSVGRVPLLLLDSDVAQNDPADRPIASVLYVRGREMRLAQEMLLGVGGVRALAALDIEPAVWHLNEGHSSLLQLERLRRLTNGDGSKLEAALAQCRASTVFTVHTPVPAGHESFDRPLAAKYLEPWSERLGVPTERLLALGHADQGAPGQPLNLTALALRTSGFVNGVSRLNAEVSNRNWRHLYPQSAGPQSPSGEAGIRAITNGVHVPTWLGVEIRDLLVRHLGSGWREALAPDELMSAIREIPDDGLWNAHQGQKQRLARFARSRILSQYARHGRSPDKLREVEHLFDPRVLTLGFARRFATYKRADLLFGDLHRVRSLLGHPDLPMQVIFAGKAHPTDRPGQQMIQHIFNLSHDGELSGRVFFLENYDLGIAKMLVQGVDVWLNTPRRPQEASGTSGMKAAINGVLNCSILDGWWPEGFDGENGWAIDAGRHPDEGEQDRADALALYETLERQVAPTFYERDEEGLPRRWLAMMKRSIATIVPAFSSDRMVGDYLEQAYLPRSGTSTGVMATADSGAGGRVP
ncbi:MAG: alpha-glucan family phosphorylase [Acidobacteria bacterium]|nr:alpha-glucan family phosphorylase [Acidobacteriota bacterium]